MNIIAENSPKYRWLCYRRPIIYSPRITSLSESSSVIISWLNSRQLWSKEENLYQNNRNIYCTQLYYKSPLRRDQKIPRISIIFICTDVNTQMITNHKRISILISFFCTNTNNGYQCITFAVNIMRKSRLILLFPVVLHSIRRYTCTHKYIKGR